MASTESVLGERQQASRQDTSAIVLRDAVQSHLDENDLLWVSRVRAKEYSRGKLKAGSNAWLAEHLAQ